MSASVAHGNDRLTLAMVIAGALHALVIFGISFDALNRDAQERQVEVTLVIKPGQTPLNARHFAQANQRGGELEALRLRQTPADNKAAQFVPPTGASADDADSGVGATLQPRLTANRSSREIPRASKPSGHDSKLDQAQRELARLEQELARLQADLQAPLRDEPSWREARIRRATTVAAFAAVDAAYLVDWRNRVEALGNEYYPEASRRYGIYGSLEMLVTVRSDGSLEDIEILRSSGHAVLDEAAVRIVRAAAPYSPFPAELRASTDKLEIQRTWQFEQNPLSSNQGR